jgi:hypothetical protein
MRVCRRVSILMVLELLAAPAHTFAQTSPTQATGLPPDATSWHSVKTGTNQVTYSAVAGTLPLFGTKAEMTAKCLLHRV